MQPSFIVIGSDGEKYGPHALGAVQGWINEGRLDRDSMVLKDGDSVWKKAEDIDGLVFNREEPAVAVAAPSAIALNAAVPYPTTYQAEREYQELSELAPKIKSGASWFYWIAGLTAVNSGAALLGSDWRFILGIGLSEIFNLIGSALGSIGFAVALVLNVLLIGSFVLFGVQANKGKVWAFVLGMLIFGGDTLFFVLAQEWIGVAFHAFALFCIFVGFKAARQARAVTRT